MVKKISIVLMTTSLIFGCSLASNNSHKIASATFKNNGSYSGFISTDETVESCKKFLLNESDVTQYFQMAKAVSEKDYMHDLTASNCFADGTLVSSSGKSGVWKIDRARRGMLTVDSETSYFYCSDCTAMVYYSP